MLMKNSGHDLVKKAEAVVIGGGVIGTAIAYSLAKKGVKACLLDRFDIGAGTTSSAAAAALLQTKTSAAKLDLASKSLALLDDLHEELERSFEFEHSGSLLVASTEAELSVVQDMIGKLQSLGLDVSFVEGDEARSIMPILGPGIVGASYSPRDAKVNPMELVVAQARAAERLGASLYTFTEVRGIERRGEKILSVITDKGKILTDTIINAAGVWSSEIAKMAGIDLPITPLKGELLISETMPPMMQGTLISAKYLLSKSNLEAGAGTDKPKRSVGITLVQLDHGNFLIGSTRQVAGYDRRSTYAGIRELCRQVVELVPSMVDIHIIRSYAGLRPVTPDGMPVIGRARDLPGFITAAGHGGDGLVLSAISAEMASATYLGDNFPEHTSFAMERFAVR